jgi:hypothetical protein
MKQILFVLVVLFGSAAAWAQHAPAVLGEVDTEWPGIRFQIVKVASIPGNRLFVGVRVVAGAEAPKGGTLIGTEVPIPPGASPADIEQGLYNPIPFSLDSAVMTEEKTKKTYPALAAQPGESYLSGPLLCSLRPLQAEAMGVQFAVPPIEYDEKGQPLKQVVSIILPKAKTSIRNIVLPPPAISAR